jgi:hypothetical protein
MLFVYVLVHMCACCSELLNIFSVVMKKFFVDYDSGIQPLVREYIMLIQRINFILLLDFKFVWPKFDTNELQV